LAFSQRFERLEQRVSKTEEQIELFVRTALPPVEGVFYEGQIFYQLSFSGKKRKLQRKVAFAATQVDC
jgi:hypothetical protein